MWKAWSGFWTLQDTDEGFADFQKNGVTNVGIVVFLFFSGLGNACFWAGLEKVESDRIERVVVWSVGKVGLSLLSDTNALGKLAINFCFQVLIQQKFCS